MKIVTESARGQIERAKLFAALQITAASFLIALCAQIRIPLPGTLVPLTGQVFGVLLAASVLGGKKGTAAVFLYLLEGAVGLPVWAGGASGPLVFAGPTGGYLIGFTFQAYLAGRFMETRPASNVFKTALGLSLCCCAELLFGSLWLGRFVGFKQGFVTGFLPFIPGDVAKALFVTACVRGRERVAS